MCDIPEFRDIRECTSDFGTDVTLTDLSLIRSESNRSSVQIDVGLRSDVPMTLPVPQSTNRSRVVQDRIYIPILTELSLTRPSRDVPDLMCTPQILLHSPKY